MRNTVIRRAFAGAVVGTLALAACGDDDTSEDAAAFCDLVSEAGEEVPTEEDFAAMTDTAPDEVSEDVATVADAFAERGEAAFGEVEVVEGIQSIEAWAAENCADGDQEGAGGDDGDAGVDPDAQQVDVAATEYAFDFDAPDAGPVSFVMDNQGEEPHHMIVARLADGVSLEDAMASEDAEAEGLVEPIGESETATPGQEAVLEVDDLEAGNYVMACFIPDTEGTPHAELGMTREFTVG